MERKAIYTKENVAELLERGVDWNFHASDTQEHLHALHPYPAKFIPQIPRKAIEAWSARGELIYDPFCGCGTTLLEASLLGRPAVGTDNNSVAVLVSKAKTALYGQDDLDALTAFSDGLATMMKTAKPVRKLIPTNKNFVYWFNEDVLLRLSALKGLLLQQPEAIQPLLLAVFSSIIVRVSLQDSDTRYARVEREVGPADVDRTFRNKLSEVIKQLPEIMVEGREAVIVQQADAREVPFIASGSVSLIVTSPPYLNAYDYHKYHRQRIHWLDGNIEFARDIEIGSHDEFTRPNAGPEQFFTDMGACFAEWARVLKPGGKCFIVIGDAIVSKQPVHVADRFVDQLEARGLSLTDRWIRSLHSTKRAFNANSRINQEHMLLLTKQ